MQSNYSYLLDTLVDNIDFPQLIPCFVYLLGAVKNSSNFLWLQPENYQLGVKEEVSKEAFNPIYRSKTNEETSYYN